jgi:Cu/Ag efflux pump CusA
MTDLHLRVITAPADSSRRFSRRVGGLEGPSAEVEVRYQLKPIEIGEAGLADVRICNEYGESIVTFTFPDGHEAYIARALMIRAFAKAVLIVPHTSVVRDVLPRR